MHVVWSSIRLLLVCRKYVWSLWFIVVDLSASLFGVLPLWALLLVISVIFLFGNIFLTSFKEPPKGWYLAVLILVGFGVSVMWISTVARELVSLLDSMGLMLDISPVILGLTILAWGNSLGDLVTDTSLARQGYPQMAIGGVFACRIDWTS